MKKLSVVLLICLVIFSVFSVFNIRFLSRLDDRKIFTLSEKIEQSFKKESFKLLGQVYDDTSIIGWIHNSIYYSFTMKDDKYIYRYYPETGKKEEIFHEKSIADFGIINTRDEKKIMVNCKNRNTLERIFFMEEKLEKGDYHYDVIDESNKCFFEMYDILTKRRERLFEYTIKTNAVKDDYMGESLSNNYLMYYLEEDNLYTFIKYDINTKVSKSYEISLKENANDIDAYFEKAEISSDGKTIWAIKVKEDSNKSKSTEKNLCKIDLNKKDVVPEYVTSDVDAYTITSDDRYIIYEKSSETNKDTRELVCLDALSEKEYLIDAEIIDKGYDLSPSGTKIAYLVKDRDIAKLYIKDIGDKNSEGRLIYSFSDFNRLDCIDFGSDNKSVFISYLPNETKKEGAYQMCLIKL